ncbi:MAG: hypothetical protein KBE22_03785 [Candidatus Accumulibacter sp.]|nr:hypothetical protein [Accumulibacter sp.]
MKEIINALLRYLVAVSLCLSCAAALAVPKAAENEDEAVTFGEAGSPPKPTAKHAAPTVAKAPGVARQPAGEQAKHSGAKNTTRPAGKQAEHAAARNTKPSAGKAGSAGRSSKPAAATKPPGSAKPKGASPAKAPKAAPAGKTPAKSNGPTRKK